jgi:hypothetical protein
VIQRETNEMNREQLKQLATAGTVTFPATFPRLAEIQLHHQQDLALACGSQAATFCVAIERPSIKVTLKRIFKVSDVRAVFLPANPHCVNLQEGIWLLDSEVEAGLRLHLANHGRAFGIVYVAEQTPTLLEVHAGLTAADSAQYYPPLPVDRSVNHYDPYRFAASPAPRPPRAQPAPSMDRQPLACEPEYFHYYSYCEPDYPPAPAPSAAAAPCEPDYYGHAASAPQASLFEPNPYPSASDRP